MRPTVTPNIAKAATKGIVMSLPSIKNLLINISTVPGLLSRKLKPGTVGFHYGYPVSLFTSIIEQFTIVKSTLAKFTQYFIIDYTALYSFSCYVVCWKIVPANISGKHPDNAGPTPEESADLDFCRLSIPNTASKEIHPTLKLTWHWSAFPAALFCKARPLISCLL